MVKKKKKYKIKSKKKIPKKKELKKKEKKKDKISKIFWPKPKKQKNGGVSTKNNSTKVE
jgi:hypothetical protein